MEKKGKSQIAGKKETMKNILFVIPTLRIGGAEKSLVTLLKTFDRSEANIDLLVFEPGGILQQEVPEWVNIIEADVCTRGMLLELRYYMKDLIRHRYFRAALARVWLTIRSRLRLRKKFHWALMKKYVRGLDKKYDTAVGYLEDISDYYVIDKVSAERKIGWIHTDFSGERLLYEEKAYYRQFDCLATISEACRDAFLKAMGDESLRIEVIPNIVLPEEVMKKADEEDAGWDTDKINLVTVGRLEYAKGIDIGVKACRILKDGGEDVLWHVYGEGSRRKIIEEVIKENHVEECYILEGQVRNPYPYMKNADIIVQPSRWEGKSVVLDEAKMLGKAIVTTDYSTVIDQIRDGENGIVTKCTPEAIADGIRSLINDPVLRERIEENNALNGTGYQETVAKVKSIIQV